MSRSRILVFGHSLVRDLGFWMKETSSDLLTRCDTTVHGIGGRTTDLMRRHDMHVVKSLKPDVIFLQVGGNDISPESVATDIVNNFLEFASDMIRNRAGKVIIGSVLKRTNPRRMPISQYDKRRKAVNKMLVEETHLNDKIEFRNHQSFHKSPLRDGVHLNAKGNRAVFHSVRHAINTFLPLR